jgi:hypothetical protein
MPEGRHWLKSDDADAPLPPSIWLRARLFFLADCRGENVLWTDTLVEPRRVMGCGAASVWSSACTTPAPNCVPRRGGYTRGDVAPSVSIARGLATSHNSVHGATTHALPPRSRITKADPPAPIRAQARGYSDGCDSGGRDPTDGLGHSGQNGTCWLRTSVGHRISSFVVV